MKKFNLIKIFSIIFLFVIIFNTLPAYIFEPSTFSGHCLYQYLSASPHLSGTYYASRIKEVIDGKIFIGNPYFWEYRDTMAPAFFIADWFESWPSMLGLGFDLMLIINQFIWSIIFIFLVYLILQNFGLRDSWSLLGSFFTYGVGFVLISTPVSMQIVYPFFLLFILAILLYCNNNQSKLSALFLAISLAATFYIYNYLCQIALVIIFLNLLYLCLICQFKVAKRLFFVGLGAFFLTLPFFALTYLQVNDPFYWDTMTRIGLIKTHLPTAEAIYQGSFILFVLLGWLLLGNILKNSASALRVTSIRNLMIIFGLSLFITASSNIISGKELELAQHIVRFTKIWLTFSIFVLMFYSFDNFKIIRRAGIKKIILLVLFLGLSVYGVGFYFQGTIKMLSNPAVAIDLAEEINKYKLPLEFLDNIEKEPVVIWANYRSGINNYIPIFSRHYVLFSDSGVLHFLPSAEAVNRYLVSGYLNDLTLSDIENEYQIFAGAGNAIHPYRTGNRWSKICRLFKLNYFGHSCPAVKSMVEFKGEDYFEGLLAESDRINSSINERLMNYHVAYYIFDKALDKKDKLSGLKVNQPVFEDDNYIIYKLELLD